MRNEISRTALFSAALALLALGCTSTPDVPAEAGAAGRRLPVESPWTTEFQQKAILFATEISIEGPPGLIAHVAIKQMPDQKYSARTTADGFLQEISVPADAPSPIWIQIDNLAINAVRSARILERVSDGPVRIRALGDVMWKNLETGQERTAESLELAGPRPR